MYCIRKLKKFRLVKSVVSSSHCRFPSWIHLPIILSRLFFCSHHRNTVFTQFSQPRLPSAAIRLPTAKWRKGLPGNALGQSNIFRDVFRSATMLRTRRYLHSHVCSFAVEKAHCAHVLRCLLHTPPTAAVEFNLPQPYGATAIDQYSQSTSSGRASSVL